MKSIRIIKFFVALTFFNLINFCNIDKRNPINSDTLYIFHAGSLSYPFKILKDTFTKKYPEIIVLTYACGSKQCIRNIIDFKKNWDILFSSDINLIDSFLVPNYSSKSTPFLTNEMVIAYTKNSLYNELLNSKNWYQILSKPEVKIAFSDPFSDPCGVRALAVLSLAEKYYNFPELMTKIRFKQKNIIIRPKEIDIVSLLETNNADYTIIYKSVAMHHKLNYLSLPDSLNLSSKELINWYNQNRINFIIDNKMLNENISNIIYGYAINIKKENKKSIDLFIKFLKSETSKQIFIETGHKILF